KYDHLTEVQAKTLIPILKGNNMIVKAKTGTGKTIAFGIPTIVKALELKRQGVSGIKSIVITPTRELAQQIVDEFSQTCSYGSLSNLRIGMAVGGLSMNQQFRTCFSRGGCDILVATPGRLLAFLRDSEEARSALANLNFKTLDEADRLLDIGFGRDLDAIDTILKDQGAKFQTLLFSATIDESVTSFAKRELGEDYEVVDTVDPNEPQAQDLVEQHFIGVNDWSEMYPGLVQTINKEVTKAKESGEQMKAIIFLPSVALTEHADAFLRSALSSSTNNVPVMCIHGRLTQGQRQRVADRFKKSQSAILTTTDVIARGMDFPNVTHVFQFGIPGELPSYVHRIGRTARIGNKGKSFVILSKAETPFLKVLKREYNVEAE
ncbi:DEAD-domain-containing protein, partial [Nadsonia fulvescens var. elongata DSM 6958]